MSSLHAGTIWRMLDGLAVSRALGDLHLRAGGLISSPEFSTWRALDRQSDSFLVLVSDGITEVLSAKHLCLIAAATALGAALTLRAYLAFEVNWTHLQAQFQLMAGASSGRATASSS